MTCRSKMIAVAAPLMLLFACSGSDGPSGAQGAQGTKGDPGDPGSPGDPGQPGVACWDLNQDGSCDTATEDVNQDGTCDALDCQGQGTGGGGTGGSGPSVSYVGSAVCGGCHAEKYDAFIKSGHPYKLTKVQNGQAPTRPFDSITGGVPDPPVGLTWNDITYVIGGFGWKARYVGADGYIVTGGATDTTQWNFPNPGIGLNTGSWSAYHPGEQHPYNCGSCHTTGWIPCDVGDTTCEHQDGLAGMAGSFFAGGVQCEACHGPGSNHVSEPYLVKPVVDHSAELCGKCHHRGTVESVDAKGGFIRHHEQYEEMFSSKKHAMRCVDCHDPHKSAKFADPNVNPEKSIRIACETCHVGYDTNQTSAAMVAANVDCIDCHMPRLVKSAVANATNMTGDIRTHIFAINPDQTAVQFTNNGGASSPFITLDWACSHCHGVTASNKTLTELETRATSYHQ